MKRLIFLGLLFLAAAVAARADIIYVQGDVSGTWAADTVMVTGEVRVPPDSTLVIEPGVSVLFQVWCKLIVDHGAVLSAEGTSSDSIRLDELTAGTHWKGIRFLNASDESKLVYCHLKHGMVTGSGEDSKGGAIYCLNCSPTIQNCLIDSCSASDGGSIYCTNSSPIIDKNLIMANTSAFQAGAIYCYSGSNPIISNNIISHNQATNNAGAINCYYNSNPLIIQNWIHQNQSYGEGGGIACVTNSNAIICSNIITENYVSWHGGGVAAIESAPIISNNIITSDSAGGGGAIYCNYGSNALVVGNIISKNYASGGGGLMSLGASEPLICENLFLKNESGSGAGIYVLSIAQLLQKNIFIENTAENWGGGIYSWNPNFAVESNTLTANAADAGGGICLENSCVSLLDCIIWFNTVEQIYLVGTSAIAARYCNIQDSWPGLGNISLDPAFVDTAHDDYRLLWGSPCIDAGHPDSLDPDGTRADMGAFYYDQSKPVRILLTPHEIPYLIPDSGGTMTYTLRLDTHLEEPQVATFWCDVTLPDSSIFGPLLGPATVDVYPNQIVSWVRYQGVPETAPLGVSHYNAYAVVNGDTSKDSFMFGVMGFGSDIQDLWENWGDPLGVPPAPLVRPGIPAKFALHPPHPNPFNAKTVASYELRVASEVSLWVYDTAGKLVRTLVKGWMPAGFHRAVFDGRDLPSGIYICRLQAGDFEGIQKMVLLK